MAVLGETDRQRTFAHLLRQAGQFPGGVDKPGIRSALDATDDFIESIQTSYNASLPNPFKTTADLQEKTLLFCYVAMRRAGLLTTEDD